MSALNLLTQYSSDTDSSDIDEMSTTSQMKLVKAGTKRKLQLPQVIADVKKFANEKVQDENILSNGKIRTFPHERGNWASIVYIAIPDTASVHKLSGNLLQHLNLISKFHSCEDLHVSLSKTFILRFHWIKEFISTVQAKFRDEPSFRLEFDCINIYTNEGKTRTFIGIGVSHYLNEHLRSIVRSVDSALEELRLPVFYENPSFHTSILWCVGDKLSDLLNIKDTLDQVLTETLQKEQLFSEVCNIVCKTGNQFYNFHLN